MHYTTQSHPESSSHLQPQTASYSQPYPSSSFRERFHRPLVPAFSGSQHGPDESPSPEGESHHADEDEDAQVEHIQSEHDESLRPDPRSTDCAMMAGMRASEVRDENGTYTAGNSDRRHQTHMLKTDEAR
jgi:hypothetical protein